MLPTEIMIQPDGLRIKNSFRTYKRIREFTSFILFLRSFEVMLQHNEQVNQERQTWDPRKQWPQTRKVMAGSSGHWGDRPREQSDWSEQWRVPRAGVWEKMITEM